MLSRLAAALGCLFLVPAIGTPIAHAAGGCPDGMAQVAAPDGGSFICIVATDPGAPGDQGDGGDDDASTAGSGGCQRENGSAVACVTDFGLWSDAHQCWAHQIDVPKDDPAWEGHREGSIWMCALITDASPVMTWWAPPGAEVVPLPDPGELAQEALGRLPLAAASVQTAPLSPSPSYVGVENWLWVPQSQWERLSETVTAGSTSVTVTAEPDHVVWDVGPGSKTCYDPGRVWSTGMTDDAVTSCGYTYAATSASEPGGAFAISATIRYQVDWVCSGACTSSSGSLGLVDAPAGTGSLRVLQRQTVVVQ